MNDITYRPLHSFALITLRTVIGWHFLTKPITDLSPAWSPAERPCAMTSAGYLRGASGPLAGLFQKRLISGWTPWLDRTVKIGLAYWTFTDFGAVTRSALWARSFSLGLFTCSMCRSLASAARHEGTYLIVKKH